jgi:hypothetical protein
MTDMTQRAGASARRTERSNRNALNGA